MSALSTAPGSAFDMRGNMKSAFRSRSRSGQCKAGRPAKMAGHKCMAVRQEKAATLAPMVSILSMLGASAPALATVVVEESAPATTLEDMGINFGEMFSENFPAKATEEAVVEEVSEPLAAEVTPVAENTSEITAAPVEPSVTMEATSGVPELTTAEAAPVAAETVAEVPSLEMPSLEMPSLEMPSPEMPSLEMPKLEMPSLEMPKLEMPSPEMPSLEMHWLVEMPSLEMPSLPSLVGGEGGMDMEEASNVFKSSMEGAAENVSSGVSDAFDAAMTAIQGNSAEELLGGFNGAALAGAGATAGAAVGEAGDKLKASLGAAFGNFGNFSLPSLPALPSLPSLPEMPSLPSGFAMPSLPTMPALPALPAGTTLPQLPPLPTSLPTLPSPESIQDTFSKLSDPNALVESAKGLVTSENLSSAGSSLAGLLGEAAGKVAEQAAPAIPLITRPITDAAGKALTQITVIDDVRNAATSAINETQTKINTLKDTYIGGTVNAVGSTLQSMDQAFSNTVNSAGAAVEAQVSAVTQQLPPELATVVRDTTHTIAATAADVAADPYKLAAAFGILALPSLLNAIGDRLFAARLKPYIAGAALVISPGRARKWLRLEDTLLVDLRSLELRTIQGIVELRKAARFKAMTIPDELAKNPGARSLEIVEFIKASGKLKTELTKIVLMDEKDDGASFALARTIAESGLRVPFVMRGGFAAWESANLGTMGEGIYVDYDFGIAQAIQDSWDEFAGSIMSSITGSIGSDEEDGQEKPSIFSPQKTSATTTTTSSSKSN